MRNSDRILLTGQVPNPAAPLSGCRLHTRRPFADARCKSEPPAIQQMSGGGRASCHRLDVGMPKFVQNAR
ncbi:MAG: oligopeptide/dipeptide ABC transporter ATP-binding protein [Paracoccaceae bacterium]